jgi:hypothetical protein
MIFDPIELEDPEDDWYYNNNEDFVVPDDYESVEASPNSRSSIGSGYARVTKSKKRFSRWYKNS